MNVVRDDDLTGSRLRHYSIGALIGAGGMGKVYLGRDEYLQRHVAMKVLIGGSAYRGPSPQLLMEARLLSRVIHRNVAAVYDFIIDADREWIVMEYVPGATMMDVLAGGPLPADDVLRLGLQLARGLAAAHAAGVVHRDLKPQNIKLTPRGRLKILDFGIADVIHQPRRADSATDTLSPPHARGTIPYMSPEQLRGEEADERSDIFSAGTVLYEMASGQRAFARRDIAHLVDAIQHEAPPALTAVNPLAPMALERIVARAMEKDPGRRQPCATALVQELRQLQPQPRLFGVVGKQPIPSYN